MNKVFRDTYYLFIRGFKQSLRPYIALMPEFAVPIFFFVVNSAGFQRVSDLAEFKNYAGNYLEFYAPVALLMAIFFSTGSAGIEVVTDIANGYMDRLFVSPVHRISIVLGKLLATGARSMIQAAIMLAFVMLIGAPFEAGLLGVPILLALAFIFGMAWSGIGLTLAFLTKNPRIVQSSFVFFIPFSFITTSQLPLPLLSGWYKAAVMINPVTYVLEGMRALMLNGVGPETVGTIAVGFLAAALFGLVTLGAALFAFRRLSA
ncbi:ABC transporter permease [Candidatus Acetothermia bacterium]|nr:ABC transporter permease [Candidatus Acetothermia bacterium]